MTFTLSKTSVYNTTLLTFDHQWLETNNKGQCMFARKLRKKSLKLETD